MKIEDIDTFTRHYLIAALWSTNDGSSEDGGEPMDATYGLEDIAPETVQKAYDDCQDFQQTNARWLKNACQFYDDNGNSAHPDAGSPEACAGHDFWLTRAGHGTGFWDRGMGDLGDYLTEMCKPYGSIDFYVGDDGKIYS